MQWRATYITRRHAACHNTTTIHQIRKWGLQHYVPISCYHNNDNGLVYKSLSEWLAVVTDSGADAAGDSRGYEYHWHIGWKYYPGQTWWSHKEECNGVGCYEIGWWIARSHTWREGPPWPSWACWGGVDGSYIIGRRGRRRGIYY